MNISGILNCFKPSGRSSRQIVDLVQDAAQPARVGHAGTLDHLAEGVLLVAVGNARRLIPYLQQGTKTYVGTFRWGVTSVSLDTESPLTEVPVSHPITRNDLAATIPRFVGRISQTPPVYSALKVAGRRACDRAREGEAVVLAPREIQVDSIIIEHFDFPMVTLRIVCGAGTYVRSLGDDLAQSLGTRAVMTALLRTSIGSFSAADAIPPERLNRETILQNLQPSLSAVSHLPRITLSPLEIAEIRQGRFIRGCFTGDEAAGIDPQGKLVAILQQRGTSLIGPKKVFGPES